MHSVNELQSLAIHAERLFQAMTFICDYLFRFTLIMHCKICALPDNFLFFLCYRQKKHEMTN